MIEFVAAMAIALTISLFLDRGKTLAGLKQRAKVFLNILPVLLWVLILVCIFLYVLPIPVLEKWLGRGSDWTGVAGAAMLVSISLILGFIAFPLGAILVRDGVSYRVVAVFITKLMMVGILTCRWKFISKTGNSRSRNLNEGMAVWNCRCGHHLKCHYFVRFHRPLSKLRHCAYFNAIN